MKSLIALFGIFSTVIALAVPHPHPEESGIDIAAKLAAANVPSENDNLKEQPWHIRRYDDDDRREDEHPIVRGGYVDSIVDSAVQDSLKGSERFVYYEYDDTGNFLEKRDHIYADGMDEIDSPEFITNEHPPDNVVNHRDEENTPTVEGYYSQEAYSKKRDTNYIPFGTHDSGNFLAKRDEDLEEIDVDYSPRGNVPPRDDGTPHLNECLWKFKKYDNCVERSDEEKIQRREIEADYENYWRLKGDEYDGEVDFEYISKRDNNGYDEEEDDECLKRIYEGIRYDRGKNYLPKRDRCCHGEHGGVEASQAGDYYRWGMEEGRESCSSVSEVIHYPAGDCYDNNFTDIIEYEASEVEDEYQPSVGIVGKYTASHHHTGEYTGDPPADNGYLCETTKDSPRVADVVEIANIFKHQRSGERCMARNALDSKCTKLIELGSAQLAICTIHIGWFVYCDDVGKYALELSRRCQSDINGVWRIGGTIFHESGKGSLVVY